MLGLVWALDVPHMSHNESASHCITLTDLNDQMEITKCNLIAHITSMCVRTSVKNVQIWIRSEIAFCPFAKSSVHPPTSKPKTLQQVKNNGNMPAKMQAKWSKKAWRIKLKIDEKLPLSNFSEAFSLIKKALLADVQKTPQTRPLKVCQIIRPHIQMTEQQMHSKR